MVSRREREKDDRRKYILDKAQSLFAKKGYLATSMAEIADASEFAVGSLYSFFKSKEEILATIFRYHIERVIGEVEGIRDNPSMNAREKIEASMESLIHIYVDNQDFFRIYVAEARGVEWGVRTEVGEYIYNGNVRYERMLSDIISQGIDEGVVDADLDPDFIAVLHRSFVHTTMSQYLYSGRGLGMDKLLSAAKRAFFYGIEPRKDLNKGDIAKTSLFEKK